MQLHLNSYGLYLHVKDDMFEIKNAETKKVNHLAAHKVESIWMHKSMALSTDAVFLALKHNIDIVFLECDGKPAGRVWHTKLGSTTKIRKKQLEVSLDQRAISYVQKWIIGKLENQIAFSRDLKKHRQKLATYFDAEIQKIESYISKIDNLNGSKIDEISDLIRAYEGNAGRVYFGILGKCIKPNYSFNGRSYRPAKDSFNAFLNYAYGILYSRVEKSLILAGLDPFVGFLHRDDYNYKSLVYDFIEPYRAYAEVPVLRLFSAKKVKLDHVDQLQNGCSLNKEGKEILVQKFNKHFIDDKIRYKNRNVSRSTIIQLDAHEFANEILRS